MNLKNFPKRLDSKTSSLRITVPENLDLALEGLIRKVLREQPKTDDIYSFAADYFETLLKIRDKADLKFTAAQLCPFHNDEDAHEMIKLARTFVKPIPEKQETNNRETVQLKINKTGKIKEIENKISSKKDMRKPKPKETLKYIKPVTESKQATPDLIKVLPAVTKPTETEKNDGDLEPKLNVEENGEEFLMSDPIKELVEKELLIKTDSSDKTDKIVKTAGNKDSESITIQKTEEKNSSEYTTPELVTNEPTIDKENLLKKQKQEKTDNVEEVKVDENDKASLTVSNELSENTEKASNEKTEELRDTVKEKTNDLKGEKVKEMIDTNQKSTAGASKENTNAEETNKESIKNAEETKDTPEKVTLQSETESMTTKIQQIREKDENEENVKSEFDTTVLPKSGIEILKETAEEDKNKVNLFEKLNQNQTGDIAATEPEDGKTDKTAEPLSVEKTPAEVQIGNVIKTSEQPTDEKQAGIELKSEQETLKPSLVSENTTEKILSVETSDTELADFTKAETNKNQRKEEEKPVNILLGSAANNEELHANPTKENEEKKILEETTKETNNIETTNLSEKQMEVPEKLEEKNADDTEKLQKIFDNEKVEEINKKEEQTTNEDIKTLDLERQDDKTVKDETKTEEAKPTPVAATSAHENKLESEPITDFSYKEKDKLESAPVQPLNKELKSLEEQPENLIEEKNFPDEETKKEDKKEKHKDCSDLSQNVEPEVSQTEDKTKTQKNDQTVSSNLVESQLREVKDSENKNESEEELCTVVDIQNIPEEKPEQEQEEKPKEEQKEKRKEEHVEKQEQEEKEKPKEEHIEKPDQEEKEKPKEEHIEKQEQEEKEKPKEEHIEKQEQEEKEKPKEEHIEKQEQEEKEKPKEEYIETPEQEPKEKAENVQEKDEKPELSQVPKHEVEAKEVKADIPELCKVEDAQQTPKKEEILRKAPEKELSEAKNSQIEKIATEKIAEHLSSSEENQKNIKKSAVEPELDSDNIQNTEELCTVVDIEHIPKEDKTKIAESTEDLKTEPTTEGTDKESGTKSELPTTADTIIKVEEAENKEEIPEEPQKSGEIKVKTIQTHLYDTLQVPETVKKEYKVHSVTTGTTAGLLGVTNIVHEGYNAVEQMSNTTGQIGEIVDENMNSTTEFVKTINLSPPTEEMKEPTDTLQPIDTVKASTLPLPNTPRQQDLEDSDDLLDIMTPSSENEKRYSSLEKEEPRYATLKTDGTKEQENRLEVQEVVEKTVVQSHVEAVPDPPRDLEEIQKEENLIMKEKEKVDKCEKQKLEERENSESESSEGSKDNDLPIVLVEVKTVIETQVLDEEEEAEKDGELPDVEVQVEATIDLDRTDLKTTSDGESQQDVDLQSSVEESQSQDEKTKESCSTVPTAGKEGSSGETDSTISSGATEIKRADSAKRNLSSARTLLSTQSLDLGKKNPLVKTGSLTTFRHGVTDFEVWNKIEKELEEAATKIQSKYRGYKTRKKLQRENAVQITTEESSISTTPVEAEAKDEYQQQSTGEFHDSIVLSDHPR